MRLSGDGRADPCRLFPSRIQAHGEQSTLLPDTFSNTYADSGAELEHQSLAMRWAQGSHHADVPALRCPTCLLTFAGCAGASDAALTCGPARGMPASAGAAPATAPPVTSPATALSSAATIAALPPVTPVRLGPGALPAFHPPDRAPDSHVTVLFCSQNQACHGGPIRFSIC